MTRCRAANCCREGETVYDENGDRADRLGAVINDGHLCDTCVRHVGYALGSLPGDLVELSELLVPNMTRKLRDPDMPPPPPARQKAPPLPLREDVLALQELIDYEVTVWAETVAAHIGMDLDSQRLARSRQAVRVEAGCNLLRNAIGTLVALPPVEHRARSLTTRRADGHDPDTTTRDRHDYWTVREGWQGALLLVDLHQRAQRYAGRHPGDRIPTPCPYCHRQALIREHRNNRVTCRACWRDLSDDEYETFLDAALRAHNLPSLSA